MRVVLLSIAAAGGLAGCTGRTPAASTAPASASIAPAPAPPSPADLAADLQAARQLPADVANFRVCRGSALDARDPAPLTLPAGVIFDSWGRKDGDERNPRLDADALKPDAVRYVVVLARPVTLTTAQPCAETVAQTAHSDLFEWRMPLVRKAQDLQFQITAVENHMAYPLTDRLGAVVKAGIVFGYPTADIGHPRQMREEN
ncbi:hypothetical protein ACO2Q3_07575 [Caulobacter sp. KR2-114]|uniref:hypothetical protein n=1 Tax=Caulobacter sp. KR2-114 TaxID=3400912 RepID=UPI003C0580AD